MGPDQEADRSAGRVRDAALTVLDEAERSAIRITRTKLAKLLYLADLRSVAEGDDPVSGVEWQWLQHGPYNNDLMFLENDLVREGVVNRSVEEFYGGTCLALAQPVEIKLDAEADYLIRSTVKELGALAAVSLKDMSYQTEPMRDAQERGRGVVLDLSLARPMPDVSGALALLRRTLSELPKDEVGDVSGELAEEIEEMSPHRRAATTRLLSGD